MPHFSAFPGVCREGFSFLPVFQRKLMKKLGKALRFFGKETIMTAVGVSGLWLQADASRRQSGPRKPAKAPVSMVRSRCKPGRV